MSGDAELKFCFEAQKQLVLRKYTQNIFYYILNNIILFCELYDDFSNINATNWVQQINPKASM